MKQRDMKQAVESLRRISAAGISFADVERIVASIGRIPEEEARQALELLELAAGIRLRR